MRLHPVISGERDDGVSAAVAPVLAIKARRYIKAERLPRTQEIENRDIVSREMPGSVSPKAR
jgi:hypothetical protein